MGELSKPPAGTPKGASLNQFFPGRLTINAGDKVTFSSVGFHTATYAGGKRYPPFLGPAPGQVYENIADSTGQPFFFDGEQKFAYNPVAIGPYGPKAISRGKPASSGVMPAQSFRKPTTATYSFPKTGVFKLLCIVHPPDMAMTVVVKPKGAAVPTTEEVEAQAKAQTDAAWATAKAAVAKKPPVNTVYMGVDGPKASGGRIDGPRLRPGPDDRQGRDDGELRRQGADGGAQRGLRTEELPQQAHEADGALPVPTGRAQPGDAVLHLRQRSAPDAVRRRDDARQRVLCDSARGRDSGRATERLSHHVHESREVPLRVLLHGPDMAADIRVTK